MTVCIMLLFRLLVVFLGLIEDICNDVGKILIVNDMGGIICRSSDVIITI